MPRFALDTEFVGERTYVPTLELIQVATDDEVALIDCHAVPSLDPVFAVLADEAIEKILHAGQQDLELFHEPHRPRAAPIIDTQVAAAMAGYGAQVGYAQLVERLVGVAVEKSETLTDWSRRPLTKAQLAYAVDDVRYLLPVYEELRAPAGRARPLGVVARGVPAPGALGAQPCRSSPPTPFCASAAAARCAPRAWWCCASSPPWREELARGATSRAPASRATRRWSRSRARRRPRSTACSACARCARASSTAMPPTSCAHRACPRDAARGVAATAADAGGGAVDRRRRAAAGRAAPARRGGRHRAQLAGDECGSAAAGRSATPPAAPTDLPIMQGWRKSIAGSDLLALLEGRASVALDPATGAVRVTPRRAGEPSERAPVARSDSPWPCCA